MISNLFSYVRGSIVEIFIITTLLAMCVWHLDYANQFFSNFMHPQLVYICGWNGLLI